MAVLERNPSRLVLWDMTAGRQLYATREVPPDAGAIAFSPDGRSLALGGGQPRERKDDEPDPWPRSRSDEPTIALIDAATGRLRSRLKGENQTHDLRYTPDGKLLIAGGWPQPITLWDPETGRLVGKLGERQRGGLRFVLTSDGRTLVHEDVYPSVGVRRLDGKLVRRWRVPLKNGAMVLALSPDDRTLLTGGVQDEGFRLWDITTGEERLPAKR